MECTQVSDTFISQCVNECRRYLLKLSKLPELQRRAVVNIIDLTIKAGLARHQMREITSRGKRYKA